MTLRTEPSAASALRKLLTHEASGGLILIASAAFALMVANSRRARPLPGGADEPSSRPERAALDQRRPDGAVLRHGGARDQARAARRPSCALAAPRAAGHRRAGGMVAPALVYLAFNARQPRRRAAGRFRRRPTSHFRSACWRCSGRACRCRSRCCSPRWRSSTTRRHRHHRAVLRQRSFLADAGRAPRCVLAALIVLNRCGVMRLAAYIPLGLLLWYFVLKSGVHATVAGVLFALTIPLKRSPGRPDDAAFAAASPRKRAAAVGRVPGTADVRLRQCRRVARRPRLADLLQPVTLGCMLGLFVGKQIGVFGCSLAGGQARHRAAAGGLSWRRSSTACRSFAASASP